MLIQSFAFSPENKNNFKSQMVRRDDTVGVNNINIWITNAETP
jgi:hypothetical protein